MVYCHLSPKMIQCNCDMHVSVFGLVSASFLALVLVAPGPFKFNILQPQPHIRTAQM